MSLPHESLTAKILDAAFLVSNELGIGFLESVYGGALFVALREMGLAAERQVPIKVQFHGQVVGTFAADLVVEGWIVLELKAAKALAPEHSAQILNYLRATEAPVGLLLNFGQAKLEYRRFDNRFKKDIFNRDEGDEGEPGSPGECP